ncbi:MAG TPA: hypothetical protein PK490_01050 [Prosthecobacter sp.]|nr:hypothetical protein [Prosthecobacter sp.]HRK12839.1 hypothetical protein [Prosthecobacter sp.]
MTPNRLFILIAALEALLAGMQMTRQGCPSCVLLPKAPEAAPAIDLNHTTPKP